jgi:DNA-binding transcriptional regulator YdaS (Cro superfamily)
MSLDKEGQKAFAERVESTVGHLRNVMYEQRPCATDLAVRIEEHTSRKVRRQDLRPNDYWRHWPDLPRAQAGGVVADCAARHAP